MYNVHFIRLNPGWDPDPDCFFEDSVFLKGGSGFSLGSDPAQIHPDPQPLHKRVQISAISGSERLNTGFLTRGGGGSQRGLIL